MVTGSRDVLPRAAYREVPFARRAPSGTDAMAATVLEAIASGETKARGAYTRRCEAALRRLMAGRPVTLVGSCTAGLDLSAILLGVGPGDEVIVPSFTFPSTANAFVLRGATPVFVDVDARTLNIAPDAVAAAVTRRTRAIVVMHYAGVAADMDRLTAIAADAGVALVEDAAQAICASYRGRPLGTFGALGALSFDATKNLSSGTGGALVVGDEALAARAERLRDYGTDRASFERGEVDRYRWVDIGSNFAMNELAAAFLSPQLECVRAITASRRAAWHDYHAALVGLEDAGRLRRPIVPDGCEHNGHAYVVQLPRAEQRPSVIAALRSRGVEAAFHYVPLHSAPAGLRFGRVAGSMLNTEDLAARVVRLPLDAYTDRDDVAHVATVLDDVLSPAALAA